MHLTHEKMNAKRYRKLRLVRDKYSFYRRYGAEKADVGIICWGSSKGPVKEAVLKANGRGEKVAAFVPQLLYPFPYHAGKESFQHDAGLQLSFGIHHLFRPYPPGQAIGRSNRIR